MNQLRTYFVTYNYYPFIDVLVVNHLRTNFVTYNYPFIDQGAGHEPT